MQRVRRSAGQRAAQLVLPVAMDPVGAKSLAADLLVQSRAARLTRLLRLPWRYLSLVPGMLVRVSDSGALWRVREQRFETFVVTVLLERVGFASAEAIAGDGGRRQAYDDAPVGPTNLVAVELPGLGEAGVTSPRVQVFAAGATSRWRRAAIELSQDGGESFGLAGVVSVPCIMGQLAADLAAGPVAGWDRHATLDVELLADSMWLEGASPAAVLQGANLALVGGELLQFLDVEAISPRRFKLRTLLRGRFGTEAAVAIHVAGQSFLMVRPSSPLDLAMPLDVIGRRLDFRAAGVGDDGTSVASLDVSGRALSPLSPAHLRLAHIGDDMLLRWTRRSRAGFAWLDFADAPLGEEIEQYQISVSLDGVVRRRVLTSTNMFVYSAADRLADGGGAVLQFEVAQMSAVVGPGDAATVSANLN